MERIKLQWNKNDGGRSKYYKGQADDCVVRAIAIASNRDYKEVYKELFDLGKDSPRNGVHKTIIYKFMKKHGYAWTPLMTIGSGCNHHLAVDEVPMKGSIICNLSGHLVAVVDGVIQDTHDCSRGGNRCVYGYWTIS